MSKKDGCPSCGSNLYIIKVKTSKNDDRNYFIYCRGCGYSTRAIKNYANVEKDDDKSDKELYKICPHCDIEMMKEEHLGRKENQTGYTYECDMCGFSIELDEEDEIIKVFNNFIYDNDNISIINMCHAQLSTDFINGINIVGLPVCNMRSCWQTKEFCRYHQGDNEECLYNRGDECHHPDAIKHSMLSV